MSLFSIKVKTPIDLSREKIAGYPEIRGLLLAENPIPMDVEKEEQLVLSEEESLLKRLEEIQSKKGEINKIKKERELEELRRKPAVLRFRGCDSLTVQFDLEPKNPKILEILKNLNTRDYSNSLLERMIDYPDYRIHADDYLLFEQEIEKKVPGCKFINFEPVKEPYWKIKKHEKQIVVQWNPITNYGGWSKSLVNSNKTEDLVKIPGINRRDKYYTVPLNEGWRLYSIHPEVETRLCRWEDPSLIDEIKKEFYKRLRVKEIHTAEDSPIDYKFTHWPDFATRAHQRVALEFQQLVDYRSLIAYGTGTGKTAIAIAAALKSGSKRTLVICPGALRANWKHHIMNHTGIEPIVLAGKIPTNDDRKYLFISKPEWLIINYDILRTNIDVDNSNKNSLRKSEEYFPWVDLLNLYQPEYVIMDESHYVKNPSSSQSKAVRLLEGEKKMALSATPIMNRPGELWSVLNWLHPDQFPFYETFLNQYGWGRSISDRDAKQLRAVLETIMIRRTRQDISKNLPPINRFTETFEMDARARKIYDRILLGIYEEMAEYDHLGVGGQERRFKSILPKINAMRKVCAAAKVGFTASRAVDIADEISEEPWNKVLIFTWFKGTCNTIARLLGEEALSFVTRTRRGFHTAEMEERQRLVHEFQTNPKIKFLVVTKGTASEGLDITKAGRVIFNEPFWNPAQHVQCEGRPFYREIDLHGGDSHYGQFEDSIEEWMNELNGVKQNTIDKVIEGKGMGYSTQNEIMERIYQMFKARTRSK